MKWERIEIVGVTVNDLDAAVATFSQVFDVEFEVYDFPQDVRLESIPTSDVSPGNVDLTRRNRIAIDTTGFFEFVEDSSAQEGFRNIHFKVDDLDEAKDRLLAAGFSLVAEYVIGRLREAVFGGPLLRGVRLNLLEYQGDVAVNEILEK